ncbi:MAG: hypothetical protein IJE19_08925 [Clostridia bacterium]|nr:hypothetical protein [Clostridia bacterium]
MKHFKKIFAVLILAFVVMLNGCAPAMVRGGNLTDSVYCIEEDDYPRIYLMDNETFIITFDVMDDMLIEGTYSMPDKTTAKFAANDGAEYYFTVDTENECLIFDGEKSDDFAEVFGEASTIDDGTIFNVWDLG